VNTKSLAGLYERLTPKERLPLMLAASARGDEAERLRLTRSAPTNLFKLPDFYDLAEALQMLSLFHAMQLLDLAALYWYASGQVAQGEGVGRGGEARALEERLSAAMRLLGYLFMAQADAWRQLCSELKVDGDVLLKDLPGHDTIDLTERAVRLEAYTPEQATAYLRRGGDETARVVTAEAVARDMREFLERHAGPRG
jgi:hypothetical protein